MSTELKDKKSLMAKNGRKVATVRRKSKKVAKTQSSKGKASNKKDMPKSRSMKGGRSQSKSLKNGVSKSQEGDLFVKSILNRITKGPSGDSNNLDTNDLFRVIDLLFYKDFYAYRHLPNSFNKLIDDTIPDFFRNNEHVFTEVITENRSIKHKFEFSNIRTEPPMMANGVDPLFPADARKLMLSYQGTVYADVTQYKETIDINSTGKNKIIKEKIGHTEEGIPVMNIPIMLRSKYCNLTVHPEQITDECRFDPGGYFIINGSEKIVISQDKMIPNKPMVFKKKGSNTAFHMVQVNSTSDSLINMMQTVSIKLRKDGVMVMKFPILYEVNPIIIFRALGIVTDEDIIEICAYDKTDYHMVELIRTSIDNCYNDNREGARIKIRTQEEAMDYLVTKMKVVRRYTETNQAIKQEQKKIHLLQLLKTSLLPHIKGTSDTPYREKALYLGYMINRLMSVELGRDEVDNRDSYCNKRVANINELLTEIMVQQYKSNISECNKKFLDWMKDKLTTDEPHNVIHHFKATTFEQGFKTALMQGTWPRAKGVSQMLSRISYLMLLTFLSRIDSQSSSQSSSKLTKPRQTDPSSVPFLAVAQTPEHAKVGFIKHLSLLGSITIGNKDNTTLVRKFIEEHPDIIKTVDVQIHKLKSMYKVFLNGEWIGMANNTYEPGQKYTDNPVLKIMAEAKTMKIKGAFDPQMTSIVLDIDNGEIRFSTDSGRLYRPVLRVTGDNELVLTKEIVDRIALNQNLSESNNNKITTWEELYSIPEHPIEFIDSEEQPFYMFAAKIEDLNREREKIQKSSNFQFKGREDRLENRYSDKFFLRHDYCEIHPSVLLGEITTNIPFPNRNQGPRNIFQYAQGKQGMGIYCTTYRSRTDISYVLYYPETPVANTRTSKYTYTDVLGPGANAMVAIATYLGHNQEDSLIFNLTSLQRGLFRSMSLKKYISQITKNQETSANDKFMKPPPDKTLSMKNGNYEKLNLEGYIPEETPITHGDILFGKVTPIDIPDSDKIFKDDSEQFKEKSDGVVDRMYIGITNQEGHEVRKALIRMERMPMIGDKFCCYDSTHDVLTTKGWVSVSEITKKHKVATLSNGDTLRYEFPTEIQSYDYDGNMYVIDNNQISLKVTPNHRMYVGNRQGNNYKIELAKDIKGKRRKYLKNVDNVDMSNNKLPKCLEVVDGKIKYFTINSSTKKVKKVKIIRYAKKPTFRNHATKKVKVTRNIIAKEPVLRNGSRHKNVKTKKVNKVIKKYTKASSVDDRVKNIKTKKTTTKNNLSTRLDIDAWVEFFGIWIAEGSIAASGKVISIAAHKQRVKDRLEVLCKILKFKLCKYKDKKEAPVADSYNVYSPSICKLLMPMKGSINKYLPEWVWYLSKDQSKKLINGMMLGDGHIMGGTVTMRYDTSSIKLRDDLQRLCLHAGYSANWYLKYAAGKQSIVKSRHGKKLDKQEIITSTTDSYRLTIVSKQNKPLVNKNANQTTGNGYQDKYEQFKGKVYCCTVPNDGVIYIRRNGKVMWCGNSRHGQKGTMGIGLRAVDLPHTKSAIRPDIILNPNAIPSRMTIGQFWEQLMSKVGALLGINMDCTAFENYDIKKLEDMLEALGYDRSGEEYMCNGMIGTIVKSSIFIAPAFYQRLKHMVFDKIHARSRGATTILVRQAAEGRSRDGGLRLGEMERDSLIAHGLAYFLREKMLYNSDVYSTYICGMCGLFAIREIDRNSQRKPTDDDTYKCPMCKNYHDIHKIIIPYAFKLMVQELMAMNVLIRIRVKKPRLRILGDA